MWVRLEQSPFTIKLMIYNCWRASDAPRGREKYVENTSVSHVRYTVVHNINILCNMLISQFRVVDCICKHVSEKPHVRFTFETNIGEINYCKKDFVKKHLFSSLCKKQEETLQFMCVCVFSHIIQVSEISLTTIRNDDSTKILKYGKNLKVFLQNLVNSSLQFKFWPNKKS